MSKLVLRAFAVVAVAGTLSVPTQAQTASNNIPANCTQTSSTTISCQSTLTFTVPAGLITLQSQPTGTGFALTSSGTSVNPSCTVTAPSTAVPGTTLSLSASCATYTPGYTYQWTAPSVANPTSQTISPVMTVGGLSYSVNVCYADQLTRCSTVTGSIAADSGTGVTIPSSCSITPQGPVVASGASLNLSVTCQGGSAPTTWAWRKDGNPVGSSSSSLTDIPFPTSSQATSAVYTVVVSNSAGAAAVTPSTTATKQTSTSIVNYCPVGQGYPNYEWFTSTAHNTTDIRPQYGDNIYTIKFTIASTQSTVGRALSTLPKIIFAEAPGSPAAIKDIRVSQNPCDFTGTAQVIGTDGPDGWRYISINDPSRVGFGFASITTGVWYINVRNSGCSGVCDTRVEAPGGFN